MRANGVLWVETCGWKVPYFSLNKKVPCRSPKKKKFATFAKKRAKEINWKRRERKAEEWLWILVCKGWMLRGKQFSCWKKRAWRPGPLFGGVGIRFFQCVRPTINEFGCTSYSRGCEGHQSRPKGVPKSNTAEAASAFFFSCTPQAWAWAQRSDSMRPCGSRLNSF